MGRCRHGSESARQDSHAKVQAREWFGGEYPYSTWSWEFILEAPRISYAPPKNQKKRWPTEAQMEGWFPPCRGEHQR